MASLFQACPTWLADGILRFGFVEGEASLGLRGHRVGGHKLNQQHGDPAFSADVAPPDRGEWSNRCRSFLGPSAQCIQRGLVPSLF